MKKKFVEIFSLVFGFRKFLLMTFVVVIAMGFRILELINGAEMVDLIKNVAIAFMGANGIEHLVGAFNSYTSTRQRTRVKDDPPDTDVASDDQETEDVK